MTVSGALVPERAPLGIGDGLVDGLAEGKRLGNRVGVSVGNGDGIGEQSMMESCPIWSLVWVPNGQALQLA